MTFLNKFMNCLKGSFENDRPDYYTIQKNPSTGKWNIYDEDGHSVGGYSRRYDAVRGASRAGYTLI